MRRAVCVFLGCLLVIGIFQPALAGDTHDGVNDKSSGRMERPNWEHGFGLPGEILTFADQVAGLIQAGGGTPSTNPALTNCVYVDIEFGDTVHSSNPGWPGMLEGYFQLINCGFEAGEVTLGVSITVHIPGRIDTTLEYPSVAVVMDSGEVIYRDIAFPLPSFEATYAFCVTASSGETSSSDCETVTVVGSPDPGIPFSAQGMLVQGANCILFSPIFGSGHNTPEFALDNYGDFSAGDTVLVEGYLDMTCETECEGADGCILGNTIETYDPPTPPGQTFGACGVLVQGVECLLFSSSPDTLSQMLLSLDNYGQFGEGDSVFVFGYLDPNCESMCAGPDGCLRNNTIDPCNTTPPPPPGYWIETCGILLPGTGCVVFMPFNVAPGASSYVLDDYGSFGVYDSVRVTGYAVIDTFSFCPEAGGIVTDNTIERCGGTPPPGRYFSACGLLVQGYECVLFSITTDSLDPFQLALDNYGPYEVDDTVFVAGYMDPACTTACIDADACLRNNTIEPCDTPPPPPPHGYPFDGCGVLVQGTGCTLFAPLGDTASALFQLIDLGPFGVGDTVHVYGWIHFDCGTSCIEAVGCLVDSTIGPCQTAPPPPPPPGYTVEECGVLLPGTNCTVFRPFTMGPVAPGFVLDHYGPYGVYDTVFVAGFAVPDSLMSCPEAEAIITDNTIGPCGGTPPPPPPPQGPFEACGMLVDGMSCVLFIPLPPGPDVRLALQNYGDFGVFDTVFVSGEIVYDSLCGDNIGTLVDNSIGECGDNPSAAFAGIGNYPNPFNPSTTIYFDLDHSTRVRVTVYNMLGQIVRVLSDGILPAGRQEVTWNGTDQSGAQVASGMYFYRVESERISEIRKMLLIK